MTNNTDVVVKQKSICCIHWQHITKSITVNAYNNRILEDVYMANTLQKMLKHLMGNYCPMCGTKLNLDT